MFYYYDPTYLMLIPGLILALYAQLKVSSTYARYKKVHSGTGLTGAQIARQILDTNGCGSVRIERVPGSLTDHYDPENGVLRLSEEVYASRSIAALGVAAHEAGHAIQDATDYGPMRIRATLVPVANIGSSAAIPLFMLGLIFSWEPLLKIGILCFSLAVLFYLVTLPVEFNASGRAVALLSSGYLPQDEVKGVKKVLSAAALTYVAAALQAILQLLRLVLLANSRRRDD
ncbi:MAG: zinc metallopeptidase [Clostridiales bacterium]|nr:zinc metallopeptidase [Clostridiales bacterium]MDY5513854.1 zinc metallopeptidase [Candidatus Ventricola sp.]